MSAAPRRLPVGLTLSTLVALAILVVLGSWQVQRLAWKRDLLDRVAALQAAPARLLDAALAAQPADAQNFVRVRAVCPGLSKAPYVELYGVRDGQAGVRLISACRLDLGRYHSILVDRGFVADTISARPPSDPADATPVDVVGVLRIPDAANAFTPPSDPAANRWYARDVAAMADALGAERPSPLVLFAETATNPEWTALTPAPLPTEIPNRHLGYAITWFGLAAALVGVYAALLRRRWKA